MNSPHNINRGNGHRRGFSGARKLTPLSRRTILRGAGVGIALPVLDAMFDRHGMFHGIGNAATAPPVRLFFVFYPDGIQGARSDRNMNLGGWTPTDEGPAYALTPTLAGLEPVKGDVNVISYLRPPQYAMSDAPGGCCHCSGMPTMLAGVPHTGKGAGGPTADIVAARDLGKDTAISSMNIAAHSGGGGAGLLKTCSYLARDQANPPVLDPNAIFSRLFGAGSVSGPTFTGGGTAGSGGTAPGAGDPAAKYRKSVLDYVKSEIGRLNLVLGASDKVRLDAHLSAVRELEKEIAVISQTSQPPPAPTPAPMTTGMPAGSAPSGCAKPDISGGSDYPAKLNIMFRLATMAFACDRTRVMVLQYSQALSYVKYPFLGINYEDHNVSHEDNGGTPNARANYTTITKWKVEQFGKLVSMMRDVKEGAGSLLDNSLVLYFSECGIGTGHSSHSMPLLLAGRAGGQVKTGRHIKAASAASMNKLLYAMIKFGGGTASSFGVDGAEVLPGLTT